MNLASTIKNLEKEKAKLTSEFNTYKTKVAKVIEFFGQYCDSGTTFEYAHTKAKEGVPMVVFNTTFYVQKPGCINVIPAMDTTIRVYLGEELKYMHKCDKYDKAINSLKIINTTCLRCNGIGVIPKPRANSYCDREEITCPDCRGSGIIYKKNKEIEA